MYVNAIYSIHNTDETIVRERRTRLSEIVTFSLAGHGDPKALIEKAMCIIHLVRPMTEKYDIQDTKGRRSDVRS